MNLNNNIELIQSQKLVMTAQLKQSLSILNMSSLELEEEIKKESQENPLLEVENNGDIHWEEYFKKFENRSYSNINYDSDKELSLENLVENKGGLYDYIKMQLGLYNLGIEERKICEYIVDCLDKDGYLDIDEKYIIKELHIDNDLFLKCLNKIQRLEPSGIGARNLSESLLIQIKNKDIKNVILESIIKEDLDDIGKNKIKQIGKKYNLSMEECLKYIDIIRSLEPKPGRFFSNEKSIYIQPDVIVRKINNEFIVYMNEVENFNLSINNFYKSILINPSSDENAKKFIKNKLNYAASLIKNIETRKNTILRIAEVILKEQEEFFLKGPKYIKPMKLKDIANELGYHESTISRGVNSKYMLTPFGLFEFKYFFTTSIETESEEGISSRKIKNLIKDIINEENKLKPLSDDNICKELKNKGVILARRTVAKYREEMGIPSSSKRKQFIVK